MRDHHHRHAFFGQADHDIQHLAHHFGVERRGGLVKQHHNRIHAERTGDCHALLLTARELPRILVLVGHQAHPVKHFQAARLGLVGTSPQYPDLGQGQVFRHRQMRKQFEMLEHHPHLAAQLGQVGPVIRKRNAVDDDLAFLVRLQRIHGFDERGFARPGRATHHHHIALANIDRAIVEHLNGAIPLGDVLDLDHVFPSHRKIQ